jgi:hypothetical protein
MSEHEEALREWARGMLPLAAATELLIRAGYAGESRPWVRYDEVARRPWIDFSAIPELIGPMSGGERRYLRLAASLGGDIPVILGDELSGLDRKHVELVLAAVAHAAGEHEPGRTIREVGGTPTFVDVQPLYAWPA